MTNFKQCRILGKFRFSAENFATGAEVLRSFLTKNGKAFAVFETTNCRLVDRSPL